MRKERLQEARDVAAEHNRMMVTIYDAESRIEEHLRGSGRTIAEMDSAIGALQREIEDLECPRDDSFDNSIVIWLSEAFAPSEGDDGTDKAEGQSDERSVASVCARLEELGLTVRRCHSVDEAMDRARELQENGQLRCVIVGGGDAPPKAASWELGAASYGGLMDNPAARLRAQLKKKKFDPIKFLTELTDDDSAYARKFQHTPPSRTCYYDALGLLSYEDRMRYWKLSVAISSGPKDIVEYVEKLPTWEEEKMEEEDWTRDDAEAEAAAGASGPASAEGGSGGGSGRGGGTGDDGDEDEEEDDDEPPPEVPKLMRRESEGTQRLHSLRRRLERLERERALATDSEEEKRKELRALITSRYDELAASIGRRIAKLEEGAAKPASMLLELGAKLGSGVVGPSCGRDAAIALAWIEAKGVAEDTATSRALLADPQTRRKLGTYVGAVRDEITFLQRLRLAAKVISFCTSPMHRKLLNLCSDQLRTFLPHCLGKINRVSFGLLTEEQCEAAIAEDPFTPRSRLKMAVPFVALDQPSAASEFAHPDIQIGLSVLAYRYSGIRWSDFVDIIDALKSEFEEQIGPAKERASYRRHENWVLSAGGRIRGLASKEDEERSEGPERAAAAGATFAAGAAAAAAAVGSGAGGEGGDGGDGSGGSGEGGGSEGGDDAENDDKEVVNLALLEKSNVSQMKALYELLRKSPQVIHYYLQRFVFPEYTRTQRMKISASGQAIGGDMLVGRRLGFSGTPSDLLPKELGKCEYEVGDDGKILTTLLNPEIVSFELIRDKWTVEYLLDRIATASEPRYHALIDTGALITGYSNREVAEQLLKRGLEWCWGVVFLDDDDKQQVLVRSTGRVVSADQCGVPLERRFAFYDQVHTTGIDCKHCENAISVITLGKDMVFRDYAQGAYRMRGIGNGQGIRLFIIPEVGELIHREMRAAGESMDEGATQSVLKCVVAWLVVNSMKMEQIQWSMLQMQNISSIWRKNAFQSILRNTRSYHEDACAAAHMKPVLRSSDIAAQLAISRLLPAGAERDALELDHADALKLFEEPIDFSLEAAVPDPVPFDQRLKHMLDDNEAFVLNDAQRATAKEILDEVAQFALLEGTAANKMESMQEREQEQEQEKEIRARRDQDVEVARFVDREYSRQEEYQKPWAFNVLAEDPAAQAHRTEGGERVHPFYPLRDFKLRHHEPLPFPDQLYLSSNYFNPDWTGLRRVKNVIVLLEYAPSTDGDALRLWSRDESRAALGELDAAKAAELSKAHELLSFHGMSAGGLRREDLATAVRVVTDTAADDAQLASLMAEFCAGSDVMDLGAFRNMLTTAALRPEHRGRYYVALSLLEAETLRRILHVATDRGDRAIAGSSAELALRYSPVSSTAAGDAGDAGIVLAASPGWWAGGARPDTGHTAYETALARGCFRYFDGDMHYTEQTLQIMIRGLQRASVSQRQQFFSSVMGCRRRMVRNAQETPLQKVFTIEHEWRALKQRALAAFIRAALRQRGITRWEAFTAFDADDNGLLSPAEFWGALRWLGAPGTLVVDDIVDFFTAADKGDGQLDYREYMDMIAEGEDAEDAEAAEAAVGGDDQDGREDGGERRATLPKVEPYGADVIREAMVWRKRELLAKAREEKARRLAYEEALDVKIFEEELRASRNRAGGPNPGLKAVPLDGATFAATDFDFGVNEQPLRMNTTGTATFIPIYYGTPFQPKVQPLCCPNKASHGKMRRGFDYSWMNCYICNKVGTNLACPRYCGAHVCNKCAEGHRRAQEEAHRNPKGQHTFLRIAQGSSFTVQLPNPSAYRAIVEDKDNPAAAEGADGATVRGMDEELIPLELDNSEPDHFTVVIDARFAKLPTPGQLQALLRFSLPEHTRTRRRHIASLYLNCNGELGGATLRTQLDPIGVVRKKQLARATRVFESAHPYKANVNTVFKVAVRGAKRLRIKFDEQTSTEWGCDWLQFYADYDCQEQLSERFFGGRNGTDKRFPGLDGTDVLELPTRKGAVYAKFVTDYSNEDWGWKFTAESIPVADNGGEAEQDADADTSKKDKKKKKKKRRKKKRKEGKTGKAEDAQEDAGEDAETAEGGADVNAAEAPSDDASTAAAQATSASTGEDKAPEAGGAEEGGEASEDSAAAAVAASDEASDKPTAPADGPAQNAVKATKEPSPALGGGEGEGETGTPPAPAAAPDAPAAALAEAKEGGQEESKGSDGDGDGAADAPAAAAAGEVPTAAGEAEPPRPVRVEAGKWHILALAVDVKGGSIQCFLDGKAMGPPVTNIDAEELRLRHKLVAFGGGKQAENRGGDIRRLVVVRGDVSAEDQASLYTLAICSHPMYGLLLRKAQAVFRGFLERKRRGLIKSLKKAEEKAEDEDEEEDESGRDSDSDSGSGSGSDSGSSSGSDGEGDGDGESGSDSGSDNDEGEEGANEAGDEDETQEELGTGNEDL